MIHCIICIINSFFGKMINDAIDSTRDSSINNSISQIEQAPDLKMKKEEEVSVNT